MANVKICDKCKKVIPSGERWVEGTNYPIKKKGIKFIINKQTVEILVTIQLKCGNNLDLCNKCGFKMIYKIARDDKNEPKTH